MTDENVIGFPTAAELTPEEEHGQRVMAEATRLAALAPSEWKIWFERSAERLGIEPKLLAELIEAQIADREQKKSRELVEARLGEDRAKRLRLSERDRKLDAVAKSKAEMAAEREAEKAAEKETARQQKEAERKAKEKTKTFGNIMRLPAARHEKELQRLAERLGEDAAALREEFAEFLGIGAEVSIEKTEPWPEPIDTATLLQECGGKISRYVVLQENLLTTSVLWSGHCWLYDHNVPTHSPMLVPTSAEPDSGKSLLVVVVGHTTPRFSLNIEMTGPSLYRHVDAVKPTLGIDEADDLFVRKSDLKHIINAGWTRGAKIPRYVNIGGVWVMVHFDPFTPKVIALLGRNLPPATRSRSIELRMLPKREDEKVDEFQHVDDAEFAVLRRKFARWAIDNAAALKEAKPTVPSELNNRAAANWKLLLAISELAGGEWPKRAREAAKQLTRKGRLPSDGIKLLAAIRTMFAKSGNEVISSKTVVAELIKNPDDIWVAYHHGSAITQRQVAHLLSAYDITPDTVHPTGSSSDSPQGYKLAQFEDAFARYLPNDPHIHTHQNKPRKSRPKRKLRKRRKK